MENNNNQPQPSATEPAPQQAAEPQPQNQSQNQSLLVKSAVAPGWRKRIVARLGRAKAAIAGSWYKIAVVSLLLIIAILLACGCGRKATAHVPTREENFAEYLRLLNQREVRELTPDEDNRLLELGTKLASEPPAWAAKEGRP